MRLPILLNLMWGFATAAAIASCGWNGRTDIPCPTDPSDPLYHAPVCVESRARDAGPDAETNPACGESAAVGPLPKSMASRSRWRGSAALV